MAVDSSMDEERELAWGVRRRTADASWVLLFADGLLIGCTALYWAARGHFFDPKFYESVVGMPLADALSLPPRAQWIAAAGVRLAGFLGMSLSVLILAVATTSYRRGERWAWYAMWTLPLLATLDFALLAGYGAISPISTAWDLTLLVSALLALTASYRRFFPD
jgi:hypothetical protein